MPQSNRLNLKKSVSGAAPRSGAWKWAVGLFFLLVIVDGALRKWVFPGYSTLLLILKDIVLWGGVIVYASQRPLTELPRPLRRTWIPTLLGAYIFIVLLQATNFRQPSLFISALGLKAHLSYLPLVVLLPALISRVTERQTERLLWGYAICIFLPIVALSIYQFYQPPTAWVNKYVNEANAIDILTENIVRVTGTFSYISTFNAYLSFNAFLSTTVLIAGIRWRRRNLMMLGGSLLVATLIVLPMTGSRSVILVSAGGIAALLLGTKAVGGKRLRIFGAVALIALVAAQGMAGTGLVKGWKAFGSRVERAGGEEAVQERTFNRIKGPLIGLRRGGFLGHGVGTTHQSAERFASGTGHPWLPNGFIEIPQARVFIELGIGWLVLVTLKVALVYLAFRTVQQSHSPFELIIGGTAFCVLLAGLGHALIFNLVRNAFYWGSAGAMLGVWSLQHMRQCWGDRGGHLADTTSHASAR